MKIKKYNLLLIAFIYFLSFFPSNQSYKKEHILYEHKGKLSLGGAFLFPFGMNILFKKISWISQYPAVKKYNNLSLYKKFFLGVPFGTTFSFLSYIGLSNLPFKGEKYTGFVYPKEELLIDDSKKQERGGGVRDQLKRLGLKIDDHEYINDASYLNRTNVSAIIKVLKEADIRNVLKIAQRYNLKVGIAGARHSMGGQAFVEDGLILDMSQFNQIEMVDDGNLFVESGALFSDIQHFLD